MPRKAMDAHNQGVVNKINHMKLFVAVLVCSLFLGYLIVKLINKDKPVNCGFSYGLDAHDDSIRLYQNGVQVAAFGYTNEIGQFIIKDNQ
jgi:hypothetical protein